MAGVELERSNSCSFGNAPVKNGGEKLGLSRAEACSMSTASRRYSAALLFVNVHASSGCVALSPGVALEALVRGRGSEIGGETRLEGRSDYHSRQQTDRRAIIFIYGMCSSIILVGTILVGTDSAVDPGSSVVFGFGSAGVGSARVRTRSGNMAMDASCSRQVRLEVSVRGDVLARSPSSASNRGGAPSKTCPENARESAEPVHAYPSRVLCAQLQ